MDTVTQIGLGAAVGEAVLGRQIGRRAWNVPYQNGKVLHDLIVRNHYTRALEIGTSSGHSAIWIAWALSKIGGKLITIEIDAKLRQKALQNFKAAGLEAFIDARLGDARQLQK